MSRIPGTGANCIPLGTLHPILRGQKTQGGGLTGPIGGSGSGESSMLNAAREAAARVTANIMGKRPATSAQQVGGAKTIDSTNWPPDKKRKRSRWGGEETKPAGVASIIPSGLSKDQEKQVLLHLQIEDISRQLRSGDLGIPPAEDRSPSPEPIYNHEGKRLNTREYRTRKKLEEHRHIVIQESMLLNPEYKPPADYKPPIQRVNDRVMIPQDDHPDINFVGLLIGPRGNTLKKLEKDTGTKVMIRGKGSVKEGKVGRKDGQPLPGEDEPLHALVTANTSEAVKKAVDQIREIIKQGIETPEGQNDLRRTQLRELARLNGTLRDEDTTRCSNCGALTHRTWQCPEKQNITGTVMCIICGGVGHIAQDCRQSQGDGDMGMPPGGGGGGPMGLGPNGTPPRMAGPSAAEKAKMDSEYMSLMAELGEGPPMSKVNMPPPPPHFHQGPPPMGGRPLLSTPPSNHQNQGHHNQQDANSLPPLMGQNFQPPWMSKDNHSPNNSNNKPPSLLGLPPIHHRIGGGGGGGGAGPHGHPGPPPPNFNGPPPPGGPPGGQFNMNHPPPGLLPPLLPQMMNQQPPPGGLMPMMPPPPPMGGGGGNPPPWAVPPPPPAAPQHEDITITSSLPSLSSMSALTLPVPPPPASLLTAPPPPPPSSDPPPPPLPTSAPWQIQANSGGVRPEATSSGPVTTLPPWQRLSQAPLTTTASTSASVLPWQQLLQQQVSTATAMATGSQPSLVMPSPLLQWAAVPPPPPMHSPPAMGAPPPSFQPPIPQGPPPPLPPGSLPFGPPPPPMSQMASSLGQPPPPPPPSS